MSRFGGWRWEEENHKFPATNGFDPLLLAAYQDNFDVVRALLRHGVDPELVVRFRSGHRSGRLSDIAAHAGYPRGTDGMLDKGAAIREIVENTKDVDAPTAPGEEESQDWVMRLEIQTMRKGDDEL